MAVVVPMTGHEIIHAQQIEWINEPMNPCINQWIDEPVKQWRNAASVSETFSIWGLCRCNYGFSGFNLVSPIRFEKLTTYTENKLETNFFDHWMDAPAADGQKCVCLDASSHSFRGSISRLNNTQHRYNDNKHLYSSIKEVSKVVVPSRTSLRKVRLKYTIWVWRLQLRMLCIVRLSRFWGSTRLGWSLPVLCAPRHPQMHVKAIAVCVEESWLPEAPAIWQGHLQR